MRFISQRCLVLFCQDPSLDDPLCSPLPLSSPLRSHNSTGDLKLEACSPLQETQPPAFRRRASTISHSPTQSSPSGLMGPPQQPSAATKPKLVRHYSVSTDSPHQSKYETEEFECVGETQRTISCFNDRDHEYCGTGYIGQYNTKYLFCDLNIIYVPKLYRVNLANCSN